MLHLAEGSPTWSSRSPHSVLSQLVCKRLYLLNCIQLGYGIFVAAFAGLPNQAKALVNINMVVHTQNMLQVNYLKTFSVSAKLMSFALLI